MKYSLKLTDNSPWFLLLRESICSSFFTHCKTKASSANFFLFLVLLVFLLLVILGVGFIPKTVGRKLSKNGLMISKLDAFCNKSRYFGLNATLDLIYESKVDVIESRVQVDISGTSELRGI